MNSYCDQHSAVQERLNNLTAAQTALTERLSAHCNGEGRHVTRREVEEMQTEIRECRHDIDRQREARIVWWDKLIMGIIIAVVTIGCNVALAHFK